MKNQFYQGIVKFTINYSLENLSFFNSRPINIHAKMKHILVKPGKQSQEQGYPPDLTFSLLTEHDYNASEYLYGQPIIDYIGNYSFHKRVSFCRSSEKHARPLPLELFLSQQSKSEGMAWFRSRMPFYSSCAILLMM